MSERGGSPSPRCVFRRRRSCSVLEVVPEAALLGNEVRFGDPSFVKVYCAMCIKLKYADAKLKTATKMVNKYSVVNTL